MYQILKWKEKVDQLFKNLSSPWYDSTALYSLLLNPWKSTWRGEHRPSLIPIPHFPLVQHAECGFGVPAEEPIQGQANAHPVEMALVLCLHSRRGPTGHAPHWCNQATLKLSGIFFCLFIPWSCFKRQALYSGMAAHVFRARLHQQLIQTALIFSAPI